MSVPTAKDELDVLQTVITEHEKHAFTVMAFMAAVIAGLGTAVLSWKTRLSPGEVLLIGLGAAGTFSLWTLAHRAIALRAIDRSMQIEEDLKNGVAYTHYQVSHHLRFIGFKGRISLFVRAMGHSTFYMPLGVSLATVVGIHHLYTNNLDEGIGDSLNAAVLEAAKGQLTVRTVMDATRQSASVSATILPSHCDLSLSKPKDSATKWSVTSARCQSVVAPSEWTQGASSALGEIAQQGPSRIVVPSSNSPAVAGWVCRKSQWTSNPVKRSARKA